MIRQYRSQHSMEKAPLILVYSLAMAATALVFALDGKTPSGRPPPELSQHMRFIFKMLKESGKSYALARHIGGKLNGIIHSQSTLRVEPIDAPFVPQEDDECEAGREEIYRPTLDDNGIIGTDDFWWKDGLNPETRDFYSEQLETLAFSDEQERDITISFDWSNVFI